MRTQATQTDRNRSQQASKLQQQQREQQQQQQQQKVQLILVKTQCTIFFLKKSFSPLHCTALWNALKFKIL